MTQDEIIEMANEAGIIHPQMVITQIETLIKLAAAKEREACAKLCDGLADMHEKMNQWGSHKTADTLAQAIRARGEA